MAAKVVTLCEAVKDAINGGTYSQTFTAIRRNVWTNDLATATGLQVIVIPLDMQIESMDRAGSNRRFRLQVVIQKRFTTNDPQTEQDALLQLAEEIEDSLYGLPQGEYAFLTYADTGATRVVIETPDVQERRVFMAIVELQYKGL